MNEPAQRERARSWFKRVAQSALVVVVAVVLYVASLGPMVAIITAFSRPPDWLLTAFVYFYMPLQWLHDSNATCGKWLDGYTEVCRDLFR